MWLQAHRRCSAPAVFQASDPVVFLLHWQAEKMEHREQQSPLQTASKELQNPVFCPF